ncbi:MAG: SUF system NifU family Fe-S cluster assembly protein [Eubacteriaceae bacterium]|nr:SUF system NifU family Fe-S cluster assembly protein [Eubacteriaceae bacterium]
MDLKSLYREIINEHNLHPEHKHDLEGATADHRGVNPSCGDDIRLQLKIKDGVIEDAAFVGSGCAISQASADMMIDLIVGKSTEEAMTLADGFMRMIQGKADDAEIEALEEAAALQSVSKMPARVKCAELGWRTLGKTLAEGAAEGEGHQPHC